jgi:hypothetical protein
MANYEAASCVAYSNSTQFYTTILPIRNGLLSQ